MKINTSLHTPMTPDWADKIAEDSLQRLDKSYVLQNFRHKELDLIYQAKLQIFHN